VSLRRTLPRDTVPSADAPPAAAPTAEGLVRAIGPFALAGNVVNIIVGAGIFALPGLVAVQLGAMAWIAYAVCGTAILLVLLCYAEAGSRVDRSGGGYAYVEEAFGPLPGFLVGTLMWFGFGVLSNAAVANALYDGLAAAIPAVGGAGGRAAVLIGFFAVLAVVNVRGVKQGARLALAMTMLKLLPLIALVGVGVFLVRAEHIAFTAWPTVGAVGSASLVLFFAFAGGETALVASGEIRNSARTVPRGLLGGALGVVALYAGLQLVSQGVLGPRLAQETAAPLAAAARAVFGETGGTIVLVGALVSMAGCIAGDLLASPRTLFAAARDGLLPAPLARVHPRFHTPHVAILAYTALAAIFAVSGAFEQLAVFASGTAMLIYMAVCAATLRLRARRVRLAAPPFLLPLGPVIPLLALAILGWLLLQTSRQEVIGLGLLLVAACALYAWQVRGRPRR